MTPYWPSPLGSTVRRLAPKREVQTFLFATEPFRGRAPVSRRFPKPNHGITWIADATDLPTPEDFELGDTRTPDAG